MMNIKRVFIFSAVLASFNAIAAEKSTVYRWVDENNIVHFSQQQPSHDNYTIISMANNKKSSALVDNSDNTMTQQENTQDQNKTSDESTNKCDSARQNLSTLKDFDKIQYKDENGNLKVLTTKEKQQQLAMNEKQVEVYCTN